MKTGVKLLFFGFLIFLIGMLPPPESGIDSPTAIGPFLDGTFPPVPPQQTVVPAFGNLTFNRPMFLEPIPDTNQLLVGERRGKIYAFENNPNVDDREVYLDLSDKIAYVWDGGLMRMAFHPEFGQAGSPNAGYLYVVYCAKIPGVDYSPFLEGIGFPGTYLNAHLRLSRFEVPEGEAYPDPESELIMFNIRLYNGSHYGGGLVFGMDGMLYMTLGDMLRRNTAQEFSSNFESGILRLDVNMDIENSHPPRRKMGIHAGESDEWTGTGYYIPNDNPWQSPDSSLFEEFYSIGLRNPYTMSYDRQSNSLWIGDVGEFRREEITQVRLGPDAGTNLEWPGIEGDTVFWGGHLLKMGRRLAPRFVFPRKECQAVISGVIYRGSKQPDLYGKLIAADYLNGSVWSLHYDSLLQKTEREYLLDFTPKDLSAFGTDAEGELYFIPQKNFTNLYQMADKPSQAAVPDLLSETGIFTDMNSLEVKKGIIPYEINQPFWSDRAIKRRWFMIPNDGIHDSPEEKITFSENGNWEFPIGSVFIKHFDLPISTQNSQQVRKLETRILIKDTSGQIYGLTYRWKDDQTDAELLATELDEAFELEFENKNQTQIWHYPHRGECISCHNDLAGGILGLNTRQMNRMAYFPEKGITAHQLLTYSHLRIFDKGISPDELPHFFTLPDSGNHRISREEKARAYLDANCSYCHQSGNNLRAAFDARAILTHEQAGIINGQVNIPLNINPEQPDSLEKLIVAGDTSLSVLYDRLKSHQQGIQMPPLGKNVVDQRGVEIIRNWIMNIEPEKDMVIPPDSVSVYPNPFSEYFQIFIKEKQAKVRSSLFDMEGRKLWTYIGSGEEYQPMKVQLNIQPGFYLLRVQVESREPEIFKLYHYSE